MNSEEKGTKVQKYSHFLSNPRENSLDSSYTKNSQPHLSLSQPENGGLEFGLDEIHLQQC